jgi:hypothetical protein
MEDEKNVYSEETHNNLYTFPKMMMMAKAKCMRYVLFNLITYHATKLARFLQQNKTPWHICER